MKYIPEVVFGLIVTAVLSFFVSCDYGTGQTAERTAARQQCDVFIKYLESSKRKHGQYPAQIEKIADPWGNFYAYTLADNTARVCSHGPDGQASTPDDICAPGPIRVE